MMKERLLRAKFKRQKKIEETGGESRRNNDKIKLIQQPPCEMN